MGRPLFHSGQLPGAFQHGEIETTGLANQHRVLAPVIKRLYDHSENRRAGPIGIVDAVFRPACRRNWHTRVARRLKALRFVYFTVQDAHRAQLLPVCVAGIKPGGFAIESDHFRRQQ